ncbi:MAG: DUF2341 domain-containing protein, partial [Kiritimatiellae bacterium]|nr:DUF2341 domain-containing protein [Kiritimatiellia bacterium]
MNLKKTSALGLALSGLLTAITSAAATGTSSADNLERVGDFARRLRVTPNGSAVAAGEDYADVPVLLRLSTSIAGFDYSQFRQNGQDMMILDEAANELPFEIESWNPEGESLVWVKVKNFTSATKLTVYYGADAANEANDPKDVWSAYAGVWHLDETEGTTVADATGRGGNGTCKGNSAALESGVFAGGRHNRNKGNGETSAASGIVFDGMKSVRHNGKITLSAWVKRYHTNLCWDHLLYNKTGSSGVGGFASELYGSGNYGQIAVIGSGDNASGVYIEHGMSAADTWYHVAMVYDVQSAYLYNNGAKKGGGAMKSSMWDNGQAFSLGNDIDTNGSPWDGAFDEFRVSLGAMSEA